MTYSRIEIRWADATDDEMAEQIVEQAFDSLMTKLLDAGVVDPDVSAVLHDTERPT